MKPNRKSRQILDDTWNPRDFMRARHPDLFSDTHIEDRPCLSKAIFEYHLDTLTSRKQEMDFEHFCRKLAEKEICPNLRVQTGPTGGGDSKVDTETYPVAEEIAERWWVGSPAAGAERWAFAFSAKKAWRQKVKADVDNIISTGRDYKRIYFFSNQFISDKMRSSVEDDLARYVGIPIHIIDRSWIVEKVYENGHLDLAIAALCIEDVRNEKVRHAGPRDVARRAELEELDQQVADPSRYQGARYQLVEDCLRTAILARGLERPRNEVESRFEQANRLAKDLGYPQQLLRIAYNRAWTAYWWYEDYSAFNGFYEEVEMYVKDSAQAGEAGLLVNLWQIMMSSTVVGQISAQDAKIESRLQYLTALLETIAADPLRLNNALEASTNLALVRIMQAYRSGHTAKMEAGWDELSKIVDKCTELGDYPLERLSSILAELGNRIDSPAFDAVFEKVTEAVRHLRSDGEAGEAYTIRGKQKLEQGKTYEAIQWLGRAEGLLIKEEYRAELTIALIVSSYAYERAGLLWAARNKALAAVERTLAIFYKEGKIIGPALPTLQRLVWLELQLGRVVHTLSAMTLVNVISSHLNLSEGLKKEYERERQFQDMVLGIHFLNIPFDQLSSLVRLPDVLERLDLCFARTALLYALGHEPALRTEGWIPESETVHDVQSFFEQWQDQQAARDIGPQPVLGIEATSLFQSTILGSKLLIMTPNDTASFGLAESLLGALEAILATSDEDDMVPNRERMEIDIRVSDKLTGTPSLTFPDDSGRAVLEHPTDWDFKTAVERQGYFRWLQDSVIQIVCRLMVIRDAKNWFEKVAGRESGFVRALALGDTLTLNSNVFGNRPRLYLSDWTTQEDKEWPVLRGGPWRVAKSMSGAETRDSSNYPRFGSGKPPSDLLDRSRLKHTERIVLSPIDTELWDRANWKGTLFAYYPEGPPVLALAFEDGEAGQAIFQGWRQRWGKVDEDNALRVAIIRGLSKYSPAEYGVIIGPNPKHLMDHNVKVFILGSRINRMVPTNTTNLDTFIAAYRRYGVFILAPAQLGPGSPKPLMQMAIMKCHLHIREAWEIGENDTDISVLSDDDQPILPNDVVDPPVLKAMERLQEIKRGNRWKEFTK